jgi:hypothetical protein
VRVSTRIMFGVITAAITALSASASAHFKLLEPASWLIEDNRGDPRGRVPVRAPIPTGANQATP